MLLLMCCFGNNYVLFMLKQEQQAKAREKIEAREREEAQAKQDLVCCKHFLI